MRVERCYTILEDMESFQILEHTGEIGVLGQGTTLAQAFGQAAKAMFSFMVDLDTVQEREARQVEAEGHSREALLVAWINELIYLFDVEGLVFKRFHIGNMDDTHLNALCYGEKLDIERHKFTIVPKAATYHLLEVQEVAVGWRVQLILDI